MDWKEQMIVKAKRENGTKMVNTDRDESVEKSFQKWKKEEDRMIKGKEKVVKNIGKETA